MPKNVSIILPVINETFSLSTTADILLAENRENIAEVLVIVAERTTRESMAVIAELQKKYGSIITLVRQTLPYLGGALRDAFRVARGEWIVMMASDLETDPHDVRALIAEARKGGADIVTASRWIGGGFSGYNPAKLVLNFVFQKIFQLLYRTRLTDLTYGFRIFRRDVAQSIRWEELRHPFFFETILKPLRLGYRVREIPTKWVARREGESQNTFLRNFSYVRIGIRVLLTPRARLVV